MFRRKITRSVAASVILLVALQWIQFAFLASGKDYPDYGEFQGNPANTSEVSAGLTGQFRLKWLSENSEINREDYPLMKSSPTVWNGKVFIGDDSGEVCAIDIDNGSTVWTRKISNYTGEESSDKHGIHATPCVVAGVLYVGTHEGNIYALNTDDGGIKWVYGPIANPITSSVHFLNSTQFGQRLYFSGGDGAVYALDLAGNLSWKTQLSAAVIRSTVGIDDSRGILCVGSNDYNVYGLNITDGNLLWTFKTGKEVKSSPAIDGATGRVYVGSCDDFMYCLDVNDGHLLWKYETGGYIASSAALDGAKKLVVFASYDEKVYGLNATTGEKVWSRIVAGKSLSSPVVDSNNNLVVLGNHEGFVICLSTVDGGNKWTYPTGGKITSSVAVSGELLFVSSCDGYLYCFESFTPTPSYWAEAFIALVLVSGLLGVGYFIRIKLKARRGKTGEGS
ncbi:MAG: beta-alanine-activating enzyme beta-propeller domain-containing protein [Promethearchaeota archaeon]